MDNDYFKYTKKSRHDKAVNTLLGILEGIAADKTINEKETFLLNRWIEDNGAFADRHPYNEFIPPIMLAMRDGVLSEEEHQDLLWLCRQFVSKKYYDEISAGIQQLHAVVSTIAADGVVTEAEASSLMDWISEHEHLKMCYPYDEVESVLISALKDQWIDQAEQKQLLEFFSMFSFEGLDLQIEGKVNSISGICATSPEIIFNDRRFCFTGEITKIPRTELKEQTTKRGGKVVNDVSPRVDYLVIGSNGNPCWAYSCYGRKIEKAMTLRAQGARITLVHEVDFLDAIA